MDRNGIADVVLGLAAETSGLPVATISERTRLDDLGLDSLGLIELTVAIEDALDVEIGCGERVSCETVGCFVDALVAKACGARRLAMAA